jgi:glycerol-3-phosphate acyltransferase PlsX
MQNAIFQAINAASSNLDNIIEQRLAKYSSNQEN